MKLVILFMVIMVFHLKKRVEKRKKLQMNMLLIL